MRIGKEEPAITIEPARDPVAVPVADPPAVPQREPARVPA